MLAVERIEVGLLHNVSEIVACPGTGAAALVDPAFEIDRILGRVRARGLRVEAILLTHTHDDHVAGLDEVVAATGAPVRCHPYEAARVRALGALAVPVEDGARIPVGHGFVEALYAPGHAPGCVCWYLPVERILMTGDVLFVGSCGGVSYPDSDPAAMYETLRRIADLPEDVRIFPGHDYGPTPTSTVGWEVARNPALQAPDLAAFCALKGVPVPGAGAGRR